ncbi:Autoinducer 2 sensor kinase/phosphatase luxQ [Ralstonia mannitolilytica]|uniref:histidine kinase n=2 Tax=Ralstonia mannitolilytica TaxID=105219 RepID=A0AAJ4ZQT0_9RALS|nr:Sensor histidine kinase RcsC [Ralstonia mannitolilytica]CAJ0734365.1 Sensor histidine kinase RcsC [Ralstonia mannitolilytica]SUE24830.1 Autoinducer 2 sensor kinase/phosphatase luxQ [Ralstonia mannitolilytica]SUE26474.1 Autoinducer 2 sensor kinase/phosphatase luxQ [Ralstonia mannitolilytica]SUE36284.1 Autoinducer 2 sensor kinase/phosphatase luxQ [Ralstonia mannitolilytica]
MDAMSESITDWPAAVRTERQRCAEAGGGKRVDVFWVDDPLTGTRLHVSAAALTWGVQPEALCGVRERWLAHVHPEDHNALRAAWDGLAHGQDFVLEYRWVCDGQAERRVRERGFMMPSAVGTSAHAVGMVEDVTQPRQTLAALAESEFQLQWLIDSVPFPLVQLDPDRRVRFANRAFAQRFGLPHEDVHGRLVRDVMGEEAYACILSHLEEGFAGRRVNFEMELPYPNGLGRRFVHGAYSPQRGADGSVQALVCVIEDITESKEAERERFRHQREFVTLVENAPDVIARLDRELRCVYVNRAVNDAFDVAPAALTGRTLTASPLSAEVAQALEGAAQRAFDTRAEQTLTLHLEDGHALPRIAHYNARVIPEADRHGVMESALLIVYDVTERTEAERERDALLLREQAARAQAEAAALARDQFLAVVSHELRSPLNGIQNWTYVLESQLADGSPLVQRALAGIKTGVEQQVRLIEDLLDATRVMSGKLRLTREPFVLRKALESALNSVRALATERRITLHTRIALGEREIDGDADRVQQLVWNLLTNAIKFTPEGADVWLSADLVGEVARIEVRDNGRGIAPAFVPYLFDAFRQADGAHTRRTGGLGLGLALVKRLTELHGGRVHAHSDGEQRGATFTVYLPLHAGAELTAPLSEDPARSGPLPSLAGLRVLLVDDQQDARDALATLLAQVGADVGSVGSGRDAIAQLDDWGSNGHPQALVCDIALPDEDGYAILQKIRAWEHRHLADGAAPMAAIALTAFAQPHDRARALASGFQQHLVKPVSPHDLVRTLRSLAMT